MFATMMETPEKAAPTTAVTGCATPPPSGFVAPAVDPDRERVDEVGDEHEESCKGRAADQIGWAWGSKRGD